MIKLLIVVVFMLLRKETKSSIEAKLLILTHIRSRQSVTSSNEFTEKYKFVFLFHTSSEIYG